MTNLDFTNYQNQIERAIAVANKDDVWGWEIKEIANDHFDLYWKYDINFRIQMKGDDDLSWIQADHDYGYGLDSDMVESFTSIVTGYDCLAEIKPEDAPVAIIFSTVRKARHVY